MDAFIDVLMREDHPERQAEELIKEALGAMASKPVPQDQVLRRMINYAVELLETTGHASLKIMAQEKHRKMCRWFEQRRQHQERHTQHIIAAAREVADNAKATETQKGLSRHGSMPNMVGGRPRARSGADLWNLARIPARTIGMLARAATIGTSDRSGTISPGADSANELEEAELEINSRDETFSGSLGVKPRQRAYSTADASNARSRMHKAAEWAEFELNDELELAPPPHVCWEELAEEADQHQAAKAVMLLLQRSILNLAPENAIPDIGFGDLLYQDFSMLDKCGCEIKKKPLAMAERQTLLAEFGAVELVVTAIAWAGDDEKGDELVIAALLLGVALLLGGNELVQHKFYHWMLRERSERFFARIHMRIEREIADAKTRYRYYKKTKEHLHEVEEHEFAEASSGNGGGTYFSGVPDRLQTRMLLRLLQLLAEGHYAPIQNAFRDQRVTLNNSETYSIPDAVVRLIAQLARKERRVFSSLQMKYTSAGETYKAQRISEQTDTSGINTNFHSGTNDELEEPGEETAGSRTSGIGHMTVNDRLCGKLTTAFELLVEIAQGPNRENQKVLAETTTHIFDCYKVVVKVVEMSQGPANMAATSMLKLRSRALKAVTSLLEGRSDHIVHERVMQQLEPQMLRGVLISNWEQCFLGQEGHSNTPGNGHAGARASTDPVQGDSEGEGDDGLGNESDKGTNPANATRSRSSQNAARKIDTPLQRRRNTTSNRRLTDHGRSGEPLYDELMGPRQRLEALETEVRDLFILFHYLGGVDNRFKSLSNIHITNQPMPVMSMRSMEEPLKTSTAMPTSPQQPGHVPTAVSPQPMLSPHNKGMKRVDSAFNTLSMQKMQMAGGARAIMQGGSVEGGGILEKMAKQKFEKAWSYFMEAETDIEVLASRLTTDEGQGEAVHSRGLELKVRAVEVVWNGRLEKLLFVRPQLCKQLSQKERDEMLDNLDHLSSSRLEDFIKLCEEQHKKMKAAAELEDKIMFKRMPIKGYQILFTHQGSISTWSFRLVIFINFIMLCCLRLEYANPPTGADQPSLLDQTSNFVNQTSNHTLNATENQTPPVQPRQQSAPRSSGGYNYSGNYSTSRYAHNLSYINASNGTIPPTRTWTPTPTLTPTLTPTPTPTTSAPTSTPTSAPTGSPTFTPTSGAPTPTALPTNKWGDPEAPARRLVTKDKGGGGSGGSGAGKSGEGNSKAEDKKEESVYQFGYQSASSDTRTMKIIISLAGAVQWILCALTLLVKMRISITLAHNSLIQELEQYKRLHGYSISRDSKQQQQQRRRRQQEQQQQQQKKTSGGAGSMGGKFLRQLSFNKRLDKGKHAVDKLVDEEGNYRTETYTLKGRLFWVFGCCGFAKRAYRAGIWLMAGHRDYIGACSELLKWMLYSAVFATTTIGPMIGWPAATSFFFGFATSMDKDYATYYVPGMFFWILATFGLSTVFKTCKAYCQRHRYGHWNPAFLFITVYQAVC
jgi:hypothetical protein